jgi:hypothetical protein
MISRFWRLTKPMIRVRDPASPEGGAWTGSREGRRPRRLIALLGPARGEMPGLAMLGGLLIGSLWLLFGVMQDMIAGDPLVKADWSVLHLLLSLRVEWAAQAAAAISEFGGGSVILAVAAATLLWLDRRRAWRAMAHGVAAIMGAILFSAGLDFALQRPPPVYRQPGWSLLPFPGGHLAVFAALLGFLAVLICREAGTRRRIAVVTATLGFIAALMAAKLYLGGEFLSTALEAAAFGIAWAALLGVAYLAGEAEAIRPGGLGAVVAGVLILAGAVNIAAVHRADMRRYALNPETRTISIADWQRDGWASLPARRLSLFGDFDQPFTLQWLGGIAGLKAALLAHGWTPPVRWTPGSVLEFTAPRLDPAALPVLPRLESGRAEGLVMIKTKGVATGERLVLRLWQSDVLVPPSEGAAPEGMRPIWIGTVTKEAVQKMAFLLDIPHDTGTPDRPLRRLAAAIPHGRVVRRPGRAAVLGFSHQGSAR